MNQGLVLVSSKMGYMNLSKVQNTTSGLGFKPTQKDIKEVMAKKGEVCKSNWVDFCAPMKIPHLFVTVSVPFMSINLISCLSPSVIRADITEWEGWASLFREGSPDDFSPTLGPQDLQLGSFPNLEDGIFVIEKDSPAVSHFPQATNNCHVRKWESFPLTIRQSIAPQRRFFLFAIILVPILWRTGMRVVVNPSFFLVVLTCFYLMSESFFS